MATGELPDLDDWDGFAVLGALAGSGTDWRAVMAEAESEPAYFTNNGWAVGALQAAWSAVVHTDVPQDFACRHLQLALAEAIGIGHDTDTVAAVAGALLGARWGVSAVPLEWTSMVHGWSPTGRADVRDLVRLPLLTVRGGRPLRGSGWPFCERMDYRGWGGEDTYVAHHVVRLIDTCPEDNPNVDFAVDDAARTVLWLREQGKVVYLHCVASQSRTPTVATRVAMLTGVPLDEALAAVVSALPSAHRGTPA